MLKAGPMNRMKHQPDDADRPPRPGPINPDQDPILSAERRKNGHARQTSINA